MAGAFFSNGEDITLRPAVQRVELGIALVPEGRRLFSDLSVEDNLTVGGYRHSLGERPDQSRARLRPVPAICRTDARRSAGSLSGGEQQMLAMGRALMAEPKLLLIDELSLGLMPKMVDLCFEALARLKQARTDHAAGRAEYRARARFRRNMFAS